MLVLNYCLSLLLLQNSEQEVISQNSVENTVIPDKQVLTRLFFIGKQTSQCTLLNVAHKNVTLKLKYINPAANHL